MDKSIISFPFRQYIYCAIHTFGASKDSKSAERIVSQSSVHFVCEIDLRQKKRKKSLTKERNPNTMV